MDREKTAQTTSKPEVSKPHILEQQLRIANTISAISSRFARTGDLDALIDEALAEIGTLVSADRAYVFQFSENGAHMDNTHEWCAEGVIPQITELQNLKSESFGWFMEKVSQGEVLQINDISALPAQAEPERSTFEAQGIRSLLIMSMGPVGCPTGFVGFDNVHQACDWRPEDIDLLRVVSRLMGDAMERHHSHQALQLSVQRQKAILENIPDIAWLKDTDSRFVHVNEPFARSCGIPADELIGKTDLDIWPQDLATQYRQDDAEVMRMRRRKRIKERLTDKNLGERIVETIKTPVFDSYGRVIGTTGIARDITEQKQAERAIVENEERYRRLVESLPAIVYRYSRSKGASYWSPQVEDILGFSQQDLQENAFLWHDAIHPKDLPVVNEAIAAFEIGKPIDLKYRIEDADGNWHWFHDRSIGRLDVEDEAVIEGIAFDVTNQIRSEHVLQESEQRYRGVVEDTPVLICRFFPGGEITFVNQAYCRYFESTTEELVGRNFLTLIPEEEREVVIRNINSLTVNSPSQSHDHRVIAPDGKTRWQRWTNRALFTKEGHPVAYQAIGDDITERKQAEEALRESDSRFRQIAENIDVVLWMMSPDLEQMVYISPVYEGIWGRTCQSLYDNPHSWMDAIHAADKERVAVAYNTMIQVGIFEQEYRIVKPDGSVQWVRDHGFPIKNEDESIYRIAGFVEDITERKRTAELIQRQANFDTLTDLPNRRLLLDRLNQVLASCRRHGHFGAVFYIDLDHFKDINDSLGHPVGDVLLQGVSRRLEKVLREEDTSARLGGDEFVVLFSEVSDNPDRAAQQARAGAEKILAELSAPYTSQDHELHITASIGIAVFPMEDESADDILRHADTAMYRAKEVGRNTTRFYLPSMQLAAEQRLRLQNDMRQALLHGEWQLHFQPQVDDSGHMIRAEALLRWQHPERGYIAPGSFIPLAEETGQILAIGDWVLENVLHQSKAWSDEIAGSPLRNLAINVSPRQFRQSDFVLRFERVLDDTGADPNRLTLELTEGIFVENPEDVIQKMEALKKLGVRFSIDDFGTGYSSLAYLKRLPLDEIKIDRSFVRDITTDPNDASLVETIITMAEHLGLEVIAEGVETEEQLNFLQKHGCRLFQGYYFSRPQPVEKFTDFLRNPVALIKSH